MSRLRGAIAICCGWVVLSTGLVIAWPEPALAGTIVVTSTGDGADVSPADGVCADASGDCTLRAAVETANTIGGVDSITFAIDSSDPQFDVASTLATVSLGSPLPAITEAVVIDGTSQPEWAAVARPVIRIISSTSAPVLTVDAGSTSISALHLVGGTVGVSVRKVDDVAISRMVVVGATGDGIELAETAGSSVTNSWIGVTAHGGAGSNAGHGVFLGKFTASTQIIGNVIAANGGAGVASDVNADSNNSILGNSILGNAGLAIDHRGDDVTANDADDADPGPNDLYNFPVLSSASSTSDAVIVDIELMGSQDRQLVEIFSVGAGDPSGYGELDAKIGEIIIDAATTTGPTTLTITGAAAARLSSTATQCLNTDCGLTGPTSEAGATVSVTPNNPPTLEPIPDLETSSGDAVSIALDASDPDGGPLTWSATDLPTGTAIAGGTISGTVDAGIADGTIFNVTVTVTDSAGDETSVSFAWTIQAAASPTSTSTSTSTTTTSSTSEPTTTTSSTAPPPSTSQPPTSQTTTTVTTSVAPAPSIAPTTTLPPPSSTPPLTTTTSIQVSPVTSPPTTGPATPTSTTTPTTTTPSTSTTSDSSDASGRDLQEAADSPMNGVTSGAGNDGPGRGANRESDDASTDEANPGGGTGTPSRGLARLGLDAASIEQAALDLLARNSPRPILASGSTTSGLFALLLGLVSVIKESNVPRWPIVASTVSAFVSLFVMVALSTRRRLYLVSPSITARCIEGLRGQTGPYWGVTRGKLVRLHTPLGVKDVPEELVELVSRPRTERSGLTCRPTVTRRVSPRRGVR